MNDNKTFTEMMSSLMDLQNDHVTPRSIVGTGYRYPRSVASSWLLRQLWVAQFGSAPDELHTTTSGKAFKNIQNAMSCDVYRKLCANQYMRIDDMQVSEFSIKPCPIEGIDGYVICIHVKRNEKKVA